MLQRLLCLVFFYKFLVVESNVSLKAFCEFIPSTISWQKNMQRLSDNGEPIFFCLAVLSRETTWV